MGEEKAGGAARGKAPSTQNAARYAGNVRRAVGSDGLMYVAVQDLMAYLAVVLARPEEASTASAPKEPPDPPEVPEAQRG